MSTLSRLCILWPRFGPYHLARLEATQRLLGPRGIEIVGLETASRERLNQWAVHDRPVAFTRVQAFPDRLFEDIPPREMEAGITAALDQIGPEAVAIMSYSYPDARAALSWCRRHRRTAILTTDTKEDDAERVAWREAIKRIIVAAFDAALVSGTPQKEYLVKLGFPDDLIFLGCNVVDNAFYRARADDVRQAPHQASHLPALESNAPFFLSVNRLLPFKNLDGLIVAYAQYRSQTDAPWRLVLVGDGPDRPRLESLVAEAGVEGVVFAGYQQADAIATYYGRASVLVHPSKKDTWGLVVNEAMAAGLPVLVSDRVGCREDLVVEGQNGFLFDPGHPEALARSLTEIASPHQDLGAMGERSRAIISDFDLDRFAFGLYSAAVEGAKRSGRGLSPATAAIFGGLRFLSTDVTSFHTAEL